MAHQCGVLLGSSLRVRNIIVATSGLTPRFDMPIASVREDGGAHRPAQTNLNIYSDCALPSLGGLSVPARFFPSSDAPSPLRRFESAALTSRYDDHNPFFQLSLLLNAWAARVPRGATAMVFGEKIPQAVDDLWRAFYGDLVYVSDLPSSFSVGTAWVVGSEHGGPLMQHLNDAQPCGRSDMIAQFFASCRLSMHVPSFPSALPPSSSPRPLRVVFIQRKPYQSGSKARRVGRILLNEDAIMLRTSHALPGASVQGARMELLTQREQVSLLGGADVAIGMHGAGMVNVGFMRPGSRVIEIFPRHKRRWGYRNLCQYIGLRYVDFRGGADRGDGHKVVDPEEWSRFLSRWMHAAEDRDL